MTALIIAEEMGLGKPDYLGPTPGDDAVHYIIGMNPRSSSTLSELYGRLRALTAT